MLSGFLFVSLLKVNKNMSKKFKSIEFFFHFHAFVTTVRFHLTIKLSCGHIAYPAWFQNFKCSITERCSSEQLKQFFISWLLILFSRPFIEFSPPPPHLCIHCTPVAMTFVLGHSNVSPPPPPHTAPPHTFLSSLICDCVQIISEDIWSTQKAMSIEAKSELPWSLGHVWNLNPTLWPQFLPHLR